MSRVDGGAIIFPGSGLVLSVINFISFDWILIQVVGVIEWGLINLNKARF